MTKTMANEQLKPFTQDDPRINRNGRPRDYEALRKLVRAVGYEDVDVHEDGTPMTLIESIVRDWMTSKSFRKQLAAIQYGFGKVPEKLEVERNASKIVIRWTEVYEDPEYIEDEGDDSLMLESGEVDPED